VVVVVGWWWWWWWGEWRWVGMGWETESWPNPIESRQPFRAQSPVLCALPHLLVLFRDGFKTSHCRVVMGLQRRRFQAEGVTCKLMEALGSQCHVNYKCITYIYIYICIYNL
jgi:hypothetical protein